MPLPSLLCSDLGMQWCLAQVSRPQLSQSLPTYTCISSSVWFIELRVTFYQGTTNVEMYHKFFFLHLYFQYSVLITIIFSSWQTRDVFVRVPVLSTYLLCTSSLIRKTWGEGIGCIRFEGRTASTFLDKSLIFSFHPFFKYFSQAHLPSPLPLNSKLFLSLLVGLFCCLLQILQGPLSAGTMTCWGHIFSIL